MNRKSELRKSITWHSIKYVLTAIFAVLNLLGILHWYWVWIFFPILLSLGVKNTDISYTQFLCLRITEMD